MGFSIKQGTTESFRVTLQKVENRARTLAASYTNAAVVSWRIWAGDQTQSLASGTGTWVDPTTGEAITDPETLCSTFQFTITADDTASLEPGTYFLDAVVTSDGVTSDALPQTELELLPAPGSEPTPKTYISQDQLLRKVPWLKTLKAKSEQGGWREARAAARKEIDSIIQSHYCHARSEPSSAGSYYPSAWSSSGPIQHSDYLQTLLDSDRLEVNQAVEDHQAYQAAYTILQSLLAENDQYQKLAQDSYRAAQHAVSTAVVRIDNSSAGDGSSYLTLDLSQVRIALG